MYQKDGFTA